MTVQCLLCGRSVENNGEGIIRCEHCGIYLVFGEDGKVVSCSYEDPNVQKEELQPEPQAEQEEESVKEAPVKRSHRGAIALKIIAFVLTLIVLTTYGAITEVISANKRPTRDLEKAMALIEENRLEEAYTILLKYKGTNADYIINKFKWVATEGHNESYYFTRTLDENGRISSEKRSYLNISSNFDETLLYTYYGSGQLKEIKTLNSAGTAKETEVYHYNGSYLSAIITFEYGVTPVAERCYFYSLGKLTKEHIKYYRGTNETVETYIHDYDKHGDLIKTGYYLGDKLSYEDIFTYVNGNLVKEQRYTRNATVRFSSTTYEYGPNNRLDSMTVGSSKYTYFYDDDGRLIKEVKRNTWTDSIEFSINYTYDKYGNLLGKSKAYSETEVYVLEKYKNYVLTYN